MQPNVPKKTLSKNWLYQKARIDNGDIELANKRRASQKLWRQNHPEKIKAYYQKHKADHVRRVREWRKKNHETYYAKQRAKMRQLRLDTLTAYGNQCVCCGETQELFLSVDHYDDMGIPTTNIHNHKFFIRGRTEYARLKRMGWPKIVRIMCMNCNWGRRFAPNKICPHELERQNQSP